MLGAALVAKKACELGLQYNSKDIPVRLLYEPQPRPRAIAALVGEAIVKVAYGVLVVMEGRCLVRSWVRNVL
ncbi:hypothetical protein JHK87_004288 [Glycine soja]|nr:hypothetical protein JHK87_004288 [Glycine soja]